MYKIVFGALLLLAVSASSANKTITMMSVKADTTYKVKLDTTRIIKYDTSFVTKTYRVDTVLVKADTTKTAPAAPKIKK